MLNSAPQKLYQNLQKRQKMISKQFSQYSSASTKTSEAEIKGLSLSLLLFPPLPSGKSRDHSPHPHTIQLTFKDSKFSKRE